MKDENQKSAIKRIGHYLYKLVPISDDSGKIISHSVIPLMVEFHPRDLMQIIVGASILAVPVAFTEETWNLGQELPLINILLLTMVSFLFIASYVYYNFYRFQLKNNIFRYILRVFSIYLFSLIVVSMILTIINRCPWKTDLLLAIKRVIIVAFPASMSAAVSDNLK
jgi:uncharacterized membrane protein